MNYIEQNLTEIEENNNFCRYLVASKPHMTKPVQRLVFCVLSKVGSKYFFVS